MFIFGFAQLLNFCFEGLVGVLQLCNDSDIFDSRLLHLNVCFFDLLELSVEVIKYLELGLVELIVICIVRASLLIIDLSFDSGDLGTEHSLQLGDFEAQLRDLLLGSELLLALAGLELDVTHLLCFDLHLIFSNLLVLFLLKTLYFVPMLPINFLEFILQGIQVSQVAVALVLPSIRRHTSRYDRVLVKLPLDHGKILLIQALVGKHHRHLRLLAFELQLCVAFESAFFGHFY